MKSSVSVALLPATFAMAVLAAVMSGCSKDGGTSAPINGTVTIKGSNTFGEELAPKLIAAYRQRQPQVTVNLESKGSASGFAALLAGEADIAASSRLISPEEKAEAQKRGIVLRDYTVGHYGVAVIVNAKNPLTSLDARQVAQLFTGAVKNWSEVGGMNQPIRVFIRDPVSGTNMGFRELAMNRAAYASDAIPLPRYSDIIKAVSEDAGAVGYASMVIAHNAGVKALDIGRHGPNQLTVNEGWYPYARVLLLYTDEKRESPATRDFIRFVVRPDGQKILDEVGFVRRFEKKLKSYEID